MADYIPTKEGELVPWLANLLAVALLNKVAWNLPDLNLTALQNLYDEYKVLYDKCQTPAHTTVDVRQKNEQKIVLKSTVRDFVRFHLQNNEVVTDTNRDQLGIPVYDRTKTPVPPPSGRPVLEAIATNNRQITVKIVDQATGKKSKDPGVQGAKILSEIRDTPPVDAEDLHNALFTKRSSMVYNFEESDRGKQVYFVACWENAKGERGPWSDIVSAIVP
jgi:hypothetical protein